MSEVQSNPRGIPQAPFVENVEVFVGDRENVQKILTGFQEMMQKYKYMELNTLNKIKNLKEKIPEIDKTLKMVQYLKAVDEAPEDEKEPIIANYELNDTLYAKAEITSPCKSVNLWLGANVMLEYKLDEAVDLLSEKLSTAKTTLTVAQQDLDFLQDNITVLEVNTARVHNWDVQKRRQAEAKAGAEASK